ncbi:alpha/beta fold hydrolase [Tabrizicola sp. TH137]|uniref:alpha/beta fold hydrolase n=1 Tax=Tabrizicola sp. TH137 TaxID=2067452 RepID=UPI001C1F7D32|nr:alpha/beta hydrolase [Tabrizicola sp. TH137]
MTPSGWIMRDGFRLALHDAGGPGRVVLFQHGLCGDARQTAEAFPADAGLRRVTLDCRGHGASEFDPAPGLAKFTEDLVAVADGLGGPVPVGGISMGAALALRLAVARPDLVSHLILVRPAWGLGIEAPDNLAPNVEVGMALYRFPVAEAREAFLGSEMAARLRVEAPDNLASLSGFFAREPVSRTAVLLTALSREGLGVSAAQAAALRLPVLVCGTAEDAIHPVALARELATAIPGARYVDLPPKGRDKAAHLAALQAAISGFLTE